MRATPPRAAARAARAVAVGTIAGLALCLAGCAAAPVADPPTSASPTPSLPASTDGIVVVAAVYRTRIDASRDGIQLSITNGGDAALALDAARLESPILSTALERRDDAVIPAGATRDLPMTLVAPRCPSLSERAGPAAPDAVLVVPLADGSTAELRVPTTDRLGQWAAWAEDACFAQAVGERVELGFRAGGAGAGGGTIDVELVVRPRPGPVADGGDAEVVRLTSMSGTVLLGALDANGDRAVGIPLDIAIDPASPPDAPIVVPLRFSPNRCDAHAIADDKQGTLFRVEVAVGDRTGTVTVVSDPATKDAIYAAIGTACAADD